MKTLSLFILITLLCGCAFAQSKPKPVDAGLYITGPVNETTYKIIVGTFVDTQSKPEVSYSIVVGQFDKDKNPEYILRFNKNGKLVFDVKPDGSVVKGDGYTDDSAQEFWLALGKAMHPDQELPLKPTWKPTNDARKEACNVMHYCGPDAGKILIGSDVCYTNHLSQDRDGKHPKDMKCR